MRTIYLPTLICLAAPDATVAFRPAQSSSPTLSTRLHARREFSELDKLKAQRLGMRRPVFEPVHVQQEEEEDDHERPLEYLYEEIEGREDDAPFHILLLPSTFKDSRTSVDEVAFNCAHVLNIPYDQAYEMSMFAKYEAFSVLGAWSRKECIEMGELLKELNVECRLVPHEEWLDEWEDAELLSHDDDFDSAADIEAELSTFMEMKRAHDQDLESFMNKAKEEKKNEHPDTFSLSS
jgi:hypothetical protein